MNPLNALKVLVVPALLMLVACASPVSGPASGRHVTQGLATVVAENIYTDCREQVPNLRKTPVGRITATDGAIITVPSETAFASQPKAHPLYSDCEQVRPARFADMDVNTVPVVELDRDGEVVTGFIVADNYFELYINGKLIAVDPVAYTPFNSAIVRFRAKKPYTYAVKLVDWEEKLGLGMEWFPRTTTGTRATAASSPGSATVWSPTAAGARRPSTSLP